MRPRGRRSPGSAHLAQAGGGEGAHLPGKRLESHSQHGHFGVWAGSCLGREVPGWELGESPIGQGFLPTAPHAPPRQTQATPRGQLRSVWPEGHMGEGIPSCHRGRKQAPCGPCGGTELEGAPGQAGPCPEPGSWGNRAGTLDPHTGAADPRGQGEGPGVGSH